MDMLLGLDMLKRHQVSFETVTGSSKLSAKCNRNAMPVNLLGFFWRELMVDYLPASYERSTYAAYITDSSRVSGYSLKVFLLSSKMLRAFQLNDLLQIKSFGALCF